MPHNQLFEALLEILVCPVCHEKLDPRPEVQESGDRDQTAGNAQRQRLCCRGCGRSYPIQDGIPVMLQERATVEPPDSESPL